MASAMSIINSSIHDRFASRVRFVAIARIAFLIENEMEAGKIKESSRWAVN